MSANDSQSGGHQLVGVTASALRRQCLPGDSLPGASVLVAVSGGCDSVALLRCLAILAPRRKWDLHLTVAHVQHHLRDQKETEGDAEFVEALAKELDLPFLREDLDLSGSEENIENAARKARYAALAKIADQSGAGFVATGHHADDQLETILMRLLRGTSVKGLSGIAWKRPLIQQDETKNPSLPTMLIRPLLGVDRAQVLAFLSDIEQSWREDQTNADVTRLRARLRHEVLPVLRDIRKDAGQRAVRLADHMRDINIWLEAQIDRARVQVAIDASNRKFDRKALRQLSRVILVGLLQRRLTDAGVSVDRLGMQTLEPILDAIGDHQGGQRCFDLGSGVTVSVTAEQLTIE
jgi:tRNA(Ile)-lysidine synthase